MIEMHLVIASFPSYVLSSFHVYIFNHLNSLKKPFCGSITMDLNEKSSQQIYSFEYTLKTTVHKLYVFYLIFDST